MSLNALKSISAGGSAWMIPLPHRVTWNSRPSMKSSTREGCLKFFLTKAARSLSSAVFVTTASSVIPKLQCSYAGFTIAGNRLQALMVLPVTTMPAGVGMPLLLSRFLVAALSQLKARASGQAPV